MSTSNGEYFIKARCVTPAMDKLSFAEILSARKTRTGSCLKRTAGLPITRNRLRLTSA